MSRLLQHLKGNSENRSTNGNKYHLRMENQLPKEYLHLIAPDYVVPDYHLTTTANALRVSYVSNPLYLYLSL